jgi:hypothetical protein
VHPHIFRGNEKTLHLVMHYWSSVYESMDGVGGRFVREIERRLELIVRKSVSFRRLANRDGAEWFDEPRLHWRAISRRCRSEPWSGSPSGSTAHGTVRPKAILSARKESKMDALTDTRRRASLSDYLAAERTFLAWIRTGLALMGFGFVVARFGLFLQQIQVVQQAPSAQSYGLSLWFGTALIAVAWW